MRSFIVAFVMLAAVQTAFAQTPLRNEPHHLPAGAVVFVDNGSCASGKVLKVRGALRGLSRKKACVVAGSEQAALAE